MPESRPPFPPFDLESALKKVRSAEDAWNTRDPEKVSVAVGQWWRSYGNEPWEFATNGQMARREDSINDSRITPAERRIFGPRPESERGQESPW